MSHPDSLNAFVIYILLGTLTTLISILGLIVRTWVQSIKVSINHLRTADEEIRKLVSENCNQVHNLLKATDQEVAVLSNKVQNEKESADEFKEDFKDFKKTIFQQLRELTDICISLKNP